MGSHKVRRPRPLDANTRELPARGHTSAEQGGMSSQCDLGRGEGDGQRLDCY